MRKLCMGFVLIVFCMGLVSCLPANKAKTESGKDLPKSFVNLYNYLGLADSFYWSIKDSIRSADKKGLIDKQYKDEIVQVLKAYNSAKTSTHAALEQWYQAVDQGQSVNDQKITAVIEGMSTLAEQSEQLSNLVSEATGGNVEIQSNLGKRLNKLLTESLKEVVENE